VLHASTYAPIKAKDGEERNLIMMPRVWNAVMAGIFGAHRYCPSCGERMKRSIATEEQYTRRYAESRTPGRYGVINPIGRNRVVRQIQVTPVYDICVDCEQRIRHRNINTRLS